MRVTATRLAKRSNDYIFALAELEAFDGTGKNVALKAKVSSPDSIEAPIRWRRTNLTDGHFPIAADEKAIGVLQKVQADRQAMVAKLRKPERQARRKKLQDQITATEKELKSVPKGKMVYAAATDFKVQGNFKPTKGKPRMVKVLHRGNIQDPRGDVRPGTLPIFPKENFEFKLAANHPESARRAALAKWITRKDNPLTWRSIANRIWLWHFGQGIVETPNDFGRMGLPPSHPELLDWLTAEFRDSGGSFKHLHKLIVTSATYRQSAAISVKFAKIDSNNRFLWRMNRRQLEAEALRDTVLQLAGKMNNQMYGPGFRDFVLEHPEHSPHYEYHKHDPEDVKIHRRSVYRFLVRSQQQPFMSTLNCADPSQLVAKRDNAITALQSLALLNNKLMVAMARHFASDVEQTHTGRTAAVSEAFFRATGRPPTTEETSDLVAYASNHGLANACRLLFNLNEFSFVD